MMVTQKGGKPGNAGTLFRVMQDDAKTVDLPADLTEFDVKRMYEGMIGVRAYDERALKLQRSGRIGFCVTSFGEEATQIGTAHALRDEDWIVPAYRQHGIAMYRGVSLYTMAAHLFGNTDDAVVGRQMPAHYTFRDKNFVSASSVIGSQIIHAVGCAMAMQYKGDSAISAAYFGDGATSAADFHSALTFAGVYKAPVLFCCINNQYAISLPVEKQSGVEALYLKGIGYGVNSLRVDGNDVIAVYEATREAAERARNGEGPTLLELLTYRAGSHSSSDDPTRYRSKTEQDEGAKKDPIVRMRNYLQKLGLWDETYENEVWETWRDKINEATNRASEQPEPGWETVWENVYEEPTPQMIEQREEFREHESHLERTNEGEFPL